MLDRTTADFVICGLDGPDMADAWHLLLEVHPRIKELDLRKDGREALLWKLWLHWTVLGEASPALLIDVMRRAASR